MHQLRVHQEATRQPASANAAKMERGRLVWGVAEASVEEIENWWSSAVPRVAVMHVINSLLLTL